MDTNIMQHRARIGSFNNMISNSQTYKIKPMKRNSIYKVNQDYKFYIKILIMIPIIINALTAINQTSS